MSKYIHYASYVFSELKRYNMGVRDFGAAGRFGQCFLIVVNIWFAVSNDLPFNIILKSQSFEKIID